MTLYHLYTVWALVIATILIVRLLRGPSCAHAWQLVDKTELPSRIEVMCKNWKPANMYTSELMDASTVRATVVMRCDRCGAAKIIHMTNH